MAVAQPSLARLPSRRIETKHLEPIAVVVDQTTQTPAACVTDILNGVKLAFSYQDKRNEMSGTK